MRSCLEEQNKEMKALFLFTLCVCAWTRIPWFMHVIQRITRKSSLLGFPLLRWNFSCFSVVFSRPVDLRVFRQFSYFCESASHSLWSAEIIDECHHICLTEPGCQVYAASTFTHWIIIVLDPLNYFNSKQFNSQHQIFTEHNTSRIPQN